jgi:Fic family protein
MRTYEATHPWISFRWEPRKVPYSVWLLLGRADGLCHRLRDTAVPVDEGRDVDYQALLRGVLANAVLDGNGLTESQVHRLFEGDLRLPASQHYLRQEIEDLVKAVKGIGDRQATGAPVMSPSSVQLLNAQVLHGLPWSADLHPGEYRSIRTTTSADDGVPSEDIAPVMERLFMWLGSDAFQATHEEERQAFGIIRAILAHVYILWIRPFTEGNGRTARLVQHELLLSAGLPAAAAHQFSIQAAATRAEYFRQLAASTNSGGDPIPFIAYTLRQALDGLEALWEEVDRIQHKALWQQHVDGTLQPETSANGARQVKLVAGLLEQAEPVPPGKIPLLTPELSVLYSRLNPKTLQRDLNWLQEQGFVERTATGFRSKRRSLQCFQQDLLSAPAS